MSARKTGGQGRLAVSLSARALQDYEDILLYSLTTWGEQQMDGYQARLDRALAEIGSHPAIGRRRDDLGAGLFSLRVGQHVVFYRRDGLGVRVNRLLHARQDPEQAFDPADDPPAPAESP